MSVATVTRCFKCNGSGIYHWRTGSGRCFACNGTGKVQDRPQQQQAACTCSPETWCMLPGHNFDRAFPGRRSA